MAALSETLWPKSGLAMASGEPAVAVVGFLGSAASEDSDGEG